MAPFSDVENRRVVDTGTHIIVLMCDLGKRRKTVEACEGRSVALNCFGMSRNLHAKIVEEAGLQGEDPLLRVQNLVLVFLQVRCDVPFGVAERLLPDILRRHPVPVGVGDFNIVSKHVVEANLERRNSCPGSLRGLQVGDPRLAAEYQPAQLVEVSVESFADNPPIGVTVLSMTENSVPSAAPEMDETISRFRLVEGSRTIVSAIS